MNIELVRTILAEMQKENGAWEAKLAGYQTDGDIREECYTDYEQAKDDAGREVLDNLSGWVAQLTAAVAGLRPEAALQPERFKLNVRVECLDHENPGVVLRGSIDHVCGASIGVWVKDKRFRSAGGYLTTFTREEVAAGAVWPAPVRTKQVAK